jgi:hypothetical protein
MLWVEKGTAMKPGGPQTRAVHVIPVAAGAIPDLRLLPEIEPSEGTDGHLRRAVEKREVLPKIDGAVDEAIALDPAEGVFELDLAD